MKELLKNNTYLPSGLFTIFLGIVNLYQIMISHEVVTFSKVFLCAALVVMILFMFFISMEDGKTRKITRAYNVSFIAVSFIVYVTKIICQSCCFHQSVSSYLWEWISLGITIGIFFLMSMTSKWGLGDTLFCIGVAFCFASIFGVFYPNILLLACFISCLIIAVRLLFRKQKTIPFAPYMNVGCMITLFFVFYFLT